MSKNTVVIHASSIAFLRKLAKNNNREWFNTHKDEFIREQQMIEQFADALLGQLSLHDLIETPSGKKSLHRIYRDTRFSLDKTAYKTNWSGSFRRATSQRRGGYYFHIEPGNSFIAGGFWAPNPADLKRVREEIAYDASPLRRILKSTRFVNSFGSLQGEQVKTSPKGFDGGNDAIDLLRFKQYLLIRRFSDEEVLSESFLKVAGITFKNMRPFFDFMSAVLTVDSNGIITS